MKYLFILLMMFLPFLAHAQDRDWTVLLYLNGNNSLDQFTTTNLEQLERVGSTDKVSFVAEWASESGAFTKRLLVQKSTDPNKVTSPAIQELGVIDMGDYRTLVDFLNWGTQNYPAKHYMVIVWDHGSGWHAASVKAGLHATDISNDDNTGHAISTVQLGQALDLASAKIGRPFDIYSSDACLMAMAEIAYEMKNSVNYFVGSQELEPGNGWPYDTIFEKLAKNSAMSAAELSMVVPKEYYAAYTGGEFGQDSATMSATDLTKSPLLRDALGDLAKEIQKLPLAKRILVLAAAKASQHFYLEDYVDLGDFVNHLDTPMKGSKALAEVKAAFAQYALLSKATKESPNANGVSIWIPTDKTGMNSYLGEYKKLRFDQEIHWSDALESILK